MDLKDIFNLHKKFERVIIPGGVSQGYMKSDSNVFDDDVQTNAPSVAGTEYVAAYVEEEHRQLLEAAKHGYTAPDYETARCEMISQGTVPNMNDLNIADITKIYKTYNFAYRPKSNLTITSMKEKIVTLIETNQVTVIQGPTGCGKTTQVPQFILNSCFDKKVHCNIIVTQPRRIAAISIAKRVGEERQWPVGTLVGYRVGMVNNTSEDTRLTYCTTGVLLNKLINTKHMLDYTHVILDEVHERDQEMDFLLLVVRKLLRLNSQGVKVVLMSATFDVSKFSEYFSVPIGEKLEKAPVIDISKRTYFNVSTFYLCQMVQLGELPDVRAEEPAVSLKMMRFCLSLLIVLDGLDRQEGEQKEEISRSVILIFLPGIYEIEEMHNILTDPKNETFKWDVVVLHSSITNEEQQRIFEKPPAGYRRIILSTNIAESSITVPDVKYVIDFCLTKQLVTDPETNFQCLELTWASKTNCKQRAGRTGRVMDGRVYRLVPKRFYDAVMPEEGAPEMLRSPLEKLVLQSKLLDMGEPKAILALSLDPPDLSNLERTILLLKETGALIDMPETASHFDGYLSDLGKVMAHLPVDIHVSKLIVLGQVYNVLRDSIIIGASMSVKSMFSTPFKERLKAYNAKLIWADSSSSDCIAFLNAYKVWSHEKVNRHLNSNLLEKDWARRNFIQIKVLREVAALVQEITKRLTTMGIRETMGENKVILRDIERPFVLKVVIAGAFYPNYFVRRLQGGQMDELTGVKLLGGLDSTNTVYLTGWPINQPGLLYAQRFQKIFQECLNSPVGNVTVTFNGSSRVCVQFSKTQKSSTRENNTIPEVPGKVALAVYKAIKMRQNNVPITIPLLDHHSAAVRAKQLNLSQPTCGLLEYKSQESQLEEDSLALEEDSCTSEKNSPTSEKDLRKLTVRPILPGIDVSFIPLFIWNIDNPGHFWAHVNDDETRANMNRIDAILNKPNGEVEELTERPQIGALVVAPIQQNNVVEYYRGTVQSFSLVHQDVLCQVYYIDFGYTRQVRLNDLRTVKEDSIIHKIPGQALECVLSNVHPSILRNLKGQWSESAIQEFKDLLSGDIKLYGEIYSVVNSIVSLKLIRVSTRNNKKLVINEYLINKRFADYKEEDYLSRYNHDLRDQHSEMSAGQRRHCDQQQYEDYNACRDYPSSPAESECNTKVTLKGPNSPLEMELVHLIGAGRDKRAHIEWNSVNSILLDTEPQDPHERLLVAGSIGQNVRSGKLTLRNTTMLPNIHGLPALLSLIFAPTIELRRNSIGNRYIGALCGLGFDPITNASLFPEHDMYIPFDVEITTDDMKEINKIRYYMNLGIHVGDTRDGNTDSHQELNSVAMECQEKIKNILFRLIGKKRQSQEPEIAINSRKWNRIDPALRLDPEELCPPEFNIYRLHCALELEIENVELEAMTVHMQELRALANQDMRTRITHDIICKLCKKTIIDIQSLRLHLNSEEHRRNETGGGAKVY